MPRRRAQLAAVPPAADGRDASTGQFAKGNRGGGAAVVLLPGLDVDALDPSVRELARYHQRRFRGALTSGLFKRVGTRCHGMLRSAVLADFEHDDLAAQALRARDPKERRVLLADARAAGRQAAAHWRQLFSLVGGPVYERGASRDPLAALAAELGGEDDD